MNRDESNQTHVRPGALLLGARGERARDEYQDPACEQPLHGHNLHGEDAMDRRQFVGLTSAATVTWLAQQRAEAAAVSQPATRNPTPRPKALMKVGTQHGDSDAILRVLAGFGVNHICSLLPSRTMDAAWSVEGLTRLRERVESFGITLDMVPLPL